jgi:hypothetical protein
MKRSRSLLTGFLFFPILFACQSDERPDGAPTWEQFREASTKSFEGQTSYVIDGDMPVSLDALREEYLRLFGRSQDGVGELGQASTVNTVGGADDLWAGASARDLRYCVSDEFGALKARVVNEMAAAAAAWEAPAWVDFQYVPAADASCAPGNPNIVFAVRPWTSGGACAFFPSGGGCVARTVVVNYADLDSGAYGPVTTVGVLRHELGHTLGLRHEHIRAPGTTCTEGGTWRNITAYDSASVMHYPWCPGATNVGDLNITALDASAIASLYPRPAVRDFTDASGAVTVRIATCGWSAAVPHPDASCSVDADFVLVGGGAEVEGEGNPGGLLTASYPSSDLTTWFASSKDHQRSFAHRLRAYTIGLRLNGVPAATLRSLISLSQATSVTAAHPSVVASVPPGFNLIGGGARANYSSAGQLLTTSRPAGGQWLASSKDHGISNAGTVTAFAIGIPSGVIPGFGTLDVVASSVSSFSSGGYRSVSLATPPGWVLTSVGGDAQYSGAGRLLTDLLPFSDAPSNTISGATVRSKDHEYSSSGNTFAYVIAARKQ